MSNAHVLLAAFLILGSVTCKNSHFKNTTKVSENSIYQFKNDIVRFKFNKKTVKCKEPCELIAYDFFVLLKKENKSLIFNRFGKLVYSGAQETVEVTDNYLKMVRANVVTVINGFTGKVIYNKANKATHKLKISDNFLIVQVRNRIKIWNKYGQVIHTHKAKTYLRSYISNGFAGFQADNKQLVIFNSGQHKLVNYDYAKNRTMHINLNDNFFYFKIGKEVSSLYHVSGQRLMRFDGRPSERVFLSESVAGFYDTSSSASFWDNKGTHLKSFIKKPGLDVTMYNDKIMYKLKAEDKYKSVN